MFYYVDIKSLLALKINTATNGYKVNDMFLSESMQLFYTILLYH